MKICDSEIIPTRKLVEVALNSNNCQYYIHICYMNQECSNWIFKSKAELETQWIKERFKNNPSYGDAYELKAGKLIHLNTFGDIADIGPTIFRG